jgi:hypothetical protein
LWENIIEKGPFVGRLDVIALKFGRQVGKQKGAAFFSDSPKFPSKRVICWKSPSAFFARWITTMDASKIPETPNFKLRIMG